MIKFGDSLIPPCPFVWTYSENFLFPIEKITNVEISNTEQINKVFDKVINTECIDKIRMLSNENYDFSYYKIKQLVFRENAILNISFHSWYHVTKYGDVEMTNNLFNVNINSGLFTNNHEIKICKNGGIKINDCSLSPVHVHDIKLSPNVNTFFVDNSELKKMSFVSIVFDETIKKCCVTQHKIIFE